MSEFDITDKKYKKLRAFTMHGASLHEISGNQILGDCPFCGKERHFYVNAENLLWDCKVCIKSGNLQTFLEKINERNKKALTKKALEGLAGDRNLPVAAFEWVELGYNYGYYTIAVRDIKRKLIDLRIFKIGGKVMSTAGVSTGLFGLPELVEAKGKPAFVCEGEWDTIAMQWLLRATGKEGRAVCSPGAGTFKPEWADLFQGREVCVLYDNDKAGLEGELVVLDRLAKKVKSLKFLHWPTGLAVGYDLRDHIVKYAVQKKAPKLAMSRLMKLLQDRPRSEVSGAMEEILDEKKAPEIDPSVTIEDVFRAYEELLHEPSRQGIMLTLIIMLAGIFKTVPIWAFLVAPPSSGKTAILNGTKYLSRPMDDTALFVSHITTHSLISGMETKRGDPSIFAQLDNTNTALVIKDFTPILSMRPNDKDEVYGYFRDGYDGYTSKTFGNGIKREYNKLLFSCIAGVTEAIYDEASNFQALGERFCKLNIGRGNDLTYARNAISHAMTNRDDFAAMEDRVAKLVYSCVKNLTKKAEDCNFKLPRLSPELQKALTSISLYVGAMRGVVSRDKYKRDYIKSAPSSDMGIRNAKMLAAIAAIHAFIMGRDVATLEDLPLVKKIALDTVNQRDEELLRNIYLMNKNKSMTPNKASIQQDSRYTPYTVRCVMEDLVMLDILEKKKEGRRYFYDLSSRMIEIIKDSKLYEEPAELVRTNPKVRLNRSKTGEGRFSKKKLRIKKKGV